MKMFDALVSSSGWTAETREARLRAVAMNAIREARIAYERDDKQWFDDDARRTNLLFEILHLTEDIDSTTEALPLNTTKQPESPHSIREIERILTQQHEDHAL